MSRALEEALQQAEEALENGDYEAARKHAEAALRLSPRDPDALELHGLALAEEGDFEGADAAFEALLRLQPQNVTALLAAADVKIRLPGDDQERIDAGLELLERAEPQARRDEALCVELELLRGIAFNQLGEFEAALDAFARVLTLDPAHGEARLEQALGLFEQGRFEEARRGFEQLAREFPEEPWSFHYLGLLAERRGEDPEPHFQKARALAPEEFPLPARLSGEAFDEAVAEAIAALPAHARPHLDNAVISVLPIPTDEDVREGLSPTILGVFQGTPVDERLDTHAGHHETVRIVLFQKNLERFARTEVELREEIRITVLHEVGHLLGLDEDELFDRGLD